MRRRIADLSFRLRSRWLGSLRGRMALLLLAFTLLVGMASGSALWITESQRRDALVINLAGRQRMLLQQMARSALQWATEGEGANAEQLGAAMDLFDQTLQALLRGGETAYLAGETVSLPAAQDPAIQDALLGLKLQWEGLREDLEGLLRAEDGSPEAGAAWSAVEQRSSELLAQADQVVRLYETSSEAKLNRLRAVLLAFTLGALGLLVSGVLLVRGSVVGPIGGLGRAAERIRGGDLQTAVPTGGPEEIHQLATTLESMRGQLLASTRDLERQVERRTRELAALYEVSRELTSRLELEHVLRSVTEKARELLAGEVAFLCLQEQGDSRLDLQAFSGPEQALWRRPGVEALPVDQSFELLPALHCAVETCGGLCGVVAPAYRASHLAARLQVGERVIGALCVASTLPGQFSQDDLRVLSKLAASAAVALENARLYAQAERLAMLEERQRIAGEMHDGLAQTLIYLMLLAEDLREHLEQSGPPGASEKLERLRRGLSGAEEEARHAIARMHQPIEAAVPLQDRLRQALQSDGAGDGPATQVTLGDLAPLLLERQQSEQVLAVMREAVQNARRHAGANRIEVRLEQSDPDLCLTVEDDGNGFDASRAPGDGGRHFGLSIMRARAARLGGRLEVDSAPGRGTRVTLHWPVTGVGAPAADSARPTT